MVDVADLLKWQWEDYLRYHTTSTNLLIHIITVPIFIIATFWMLFALINLEPLTALLCIILMATSMMVQAIGHAQEPLPAVPFKGPGDALLRIFLEQLVNFPRFVISGKWNTALRKSE